MIPGLPGGGISSGGGAIAPDLSAGPSSAEGGQSGAGGQVFNFAPPVHVQEQQALEQTITKPLMIIAALGVVWVLARR